VSIADWFVRQFTRFLRNLGPDQLRDLIREAKDVETLERVQAHLQTDDFQFWHSVSMFKEELLEEIAKRLHEMGVFQ